MAQWIVRAELPPLVKLVLEVETRPAGGRSGRLTDTHEISPTLLSERIVGALSPIRDCVDTTKRGIIEFRADTHRVTPSKAWETAAFHSVSALSGVVPARMRKPRKKMIELSNFLLPLSRPGLGLSRRSVPFALSGVAVDRQRGDPFGRFRPVGAGEARGWKFSQ
jgi:hypothetical protein